MADVERTPDDARIEVVGSHGPKVVCIPSLGRDRRDFSELIPACVDAGFRAVTFDLPGVGGRPTLEDDATLHDLANDVARVIEAVGPPAHVVGHAFGTRIARCLAVDHPGLVASLVLLSCGGLLDPGEEIHKAREHAILGDNDEDRVQSLRKVFFSAKSDPTVWLTGWWPQAVRSHSRANVRTPFHEWWHGGDRPILIIQGLDDKDAVPQNGWLMRKLLGDRVRIVDLEHAGHALLPEQPDAVAEALLSFLLSISDDDLREIDTM